MKRTLVNVFIGVAVLLAAAPTMVSAQSLGEHIWSQSIRHDGAVSSVAFSSDGTKFVTASSSYNSSFKIEVSPFAGQCCNRRYLDGYTAVGAVAVDREHEYVVAGCADGTIRIYAGSADDPLRTINAHDNRVMALAISPSGDIMVTGSADNSAKIWSFPHGPMRQVLLGHRATVEGVAFSSDGRFLVTGSSDRTVRLWEIDGQPAGGFREVDVYDAGARVRSLCSAYGSEETVAIGLDDGSAVVLVIEGSRLVATLQLEAHKGSTESVGLSSGARFLATGGSDAALRLWRVSNGAPLSEHTQETWWGQSIAIGAVGFSPEVPPCNLVAGDSKGRILRWQLREDCDQDVLPETKDDGDAPWGSPIPKPVVVQTPEPSPGTSVRKTESTDGPVDGEFSATLAPLLVIEEVTFPQAVLDAEETLYLRIRLKNVGPGDARDIRVDLTTESTGLLFDGRTEVPLLEREGAATEIVIPITGMEDLPTGEASIDIRVVEPYSKMRITGKRLTITTRELRTPDLFLAQRRVLEGPYGQLDGYVNKNEFVDVKFTVQNRGDGDAEQVRIRVTNSQIGVSCQGAIWEGRPLRQARPQYSMVEPGKHETITYRYFVGDDFVAKDLHFDVSCSEARGQHGFNEVITAEIDARVVPAVGEIVIIPHEDEVIIDTPVAIEDLPPLVIDVDYDIPLGAAENPDAIAVVIGNRSYDEVGNVEYAWCDAVTIRKYLLDSFGYEEGNVIFLRDADLSDFQSVFGREGNHRGRLYYCIKPGVSDVFVYYSGHGVPGLQDRRGYFLPVNCGPTEVEMNGYPLEVFYENLSQLPARSVTVVVDACFSGATLIDGVSIVVPELVDPPAALSGGIVMTSSTGIQPSFWYKEKSHGLFTYFFLKAIHDKNADKNKNGVLTWGEIRDYVADPTDGVPRRARSLHQADQNPQMLVGDPETPAVFYR